MPSPTDVTGDPTVNVLLVDDRPANLLALEAILDRPGRNLVRVTSGEEALRLLEADDFAVVLLDVNMPGLGGFETARLVRSRERSRHTPIIFLTAQDNDEFPVVEAYRLGAVDYLVKPLVAEILEAKVAVFVDLARKAHLLRLQAEQLHRAAGEQQARAEAERRRDFVQTVLDNAPLAVAVTEGPQQRVTLLNPAGRELLGLSELDVLGTPAEVVPGGARQMAEVIDRVYRTGVSQTVPELRIDLPGGQEVDVQVTYAPLPGPDGRPVGVLHLAVDLTERKRAERALRQSEEQFRTLADSIPQLAWMARADGHIYWYNQRWYDYTGTTAEQMEGWGWQTLHDPDTLPRVLERWMASVASGEPFDMVFPLRGRDGYFRPFLTRVVPLRDSAGRVVQWFGTNTDITERVEREQALKEANRQKDAFLAMLAHELRNPLAPLLTSLQVLKQAGTDPVVRGEELARLERQARHLGRMVDDLLEVSRLAGGRLELRTERLDLARLAHTAAEDRRALVVRAGLVLEVQAPQTPVWVRGDATRLTQALNNLLDNAAKFTPAGGRVVVGVAADEAREQAVVWVADTGVGIEPALLPRLFEAFEQGAQGIDRGGGGLGLGLAVVRGLAELHQGTVEATSQGPGRGATVSVRLPLEAEPEALIEMPNNPLREARPARVLIVEDNQDAAESLRLLLEVLGHQVRVAHSGPEGVEAAARWLPEVVVSDIGLPGIDGYEVARRVRRLPGLEDALLVALTGYGAEEDRRRAREAGFSHHLVKPADPADLLRVLAGRIA